MFLLTLKMLLIFLSLFLSPQNNLHPFGRYGTANSGRQFHPCRFLVISYGCLCLSSLVRPKNGLKRLIRVAFNFLVYLLFQIKTSEPYLLAAFDVMLHMLTFVLMVTHTLKCLLIAWFTLLYVWISTSTLFSLNSRHF